MPGDISFIMIPVMRTRISDQTNRMVRVIRGEHWPRARSALDSCCFEPVGARMDEEHRADVNRMIAKP